MPRVLIGGRRLAYDLRGAGYPVLFIAGLGTGKWVWDRQVAAFSRRFLTLTYDHRGVGESDPDAGGGPASPAGYTIGDLASDAAGLLRALGIAQAHVVGVSMGGYVAQTLTIERPDLVGKLVLSSTSFGGPTSVPPEPAAWREYTGAGSLPREEAIALVTRYHFGPDFPRRQPRLARLAAEVYLDRVEPPGVVRRQASAAVHFDESGRVGLIRAQTLICHGTADAVLPAENARLLAARIPGARLSLYAGAGHALMIERAKEWNKEVLAFLAEPSGTSRGGRLAYSACLSSLQGSPRMW